MKKSASVACLVVLFLPAVTSAEAVEYSIVDLGMLPGGRLMSRAECINDRGQIGGYCCVSGMYRPFIWQSGVMEGLSTPYTETGYAQSINSSGQIAGWWAGVAVVWEYGVMQRLGVGSAADINDNGVIAGSSYEATGYDRAGVWQNEVLQDIGVLPGFQSSHASAINESGLVVGTCRDATGYETQAFIWRNGGIEPIEELRAATDINDSGQVVGWNRNCALLWQDGIVEYLVGMFRATAINNSGVVVGWSGGMYDARAQLWKDGVLQDLGTLPGGTISQAYGINNYGQVVGYSTGADGWEHAVLWQPVPEPSSLLALLCGICGVGGVLLKRRSS